MSEIGQQQQRRRQRTGRPAKNGSATTELESHRRIYDPRRWHKRNQTRHSKGNNLIGGQPPAGWVLVWAGRFKRWRRRWFVAHPPGLLLYYKNSDQIGRPGCISLLGAVVVPTAGKERQLKIKKGSRVYYLRTLNKDNRQAWLDTINDSIRMYTQSLQKAAIGAQPGRSLIPQQSIPAHLREEWEEQEKELNRRLAERMQEVEPVRQAFLQQLQALQQSLSVISGALGFTNQFERNRPPPVLSLTDQADERYMEGVSGRSELRTETGIFSQNSDGAIPRLVKVQGNEVAEGAIQGRKVDAENQPHIRSYTSEPLLSVYEDSRVRMSKTNRLQRGHSSSIEDALSSPEYDLLHDQGSCIGREFFRRRRRDATGANLLEESHLSDTEVWGATHLNRLSTSSRDRASNGKHQGLEPSCNQSIERFLIKENTFYHGPDREMGHGIMNGVIKTGGLRLSKQAGRGLDVCKGVTQEEISSSTGPDINLPTTIQGPLHSAWNSMQDAFAEILKEEIHRVIELEAENAVLQQSLVTLPQLQQDHRDLMDLRERIQREKYGASHKIDAKRDIDGDDGDDEDTDDEISIVHSEVTNEDYFEALEVLNQHEFMAKATSSEELEGLAEKDDGAYEPPEEGDCSVDTEILSEAEGEEYDQLRTRLPAPRPVSRGFSLWTVLKNAIGKDLNHITMPATINEPLSVLQRCAEELQYLNLLEKASQLSDSIERLLWVSIFACATYHGSPQRDSKPFNPLLGETYEWQAIDGKARFVTEQVSHHPPIFAFQGESTIGDYSIYGEVEIRNKFWGKSVEVLPAGVVHLRIPRYGDHFTWSKVTTCVHNVVVGKLWVDNYGDMVIKNHTTGEISRIRFHKASSREQGRLTGKVYDGKGTLQCSIHGNYMSEISVSPESTWHQQEVYSDSKCLWKAPEPPEDYEQQYCFSRFTIGLNELTAKLAEVLPPTDSRFRPDQRALEDGDLEKATPEKLRLEEKQREARKRRKEHGQGWKCMWFQQRVPGVTQVKTLEDGNVEPTWVYNGEYWSSREKKAWQNCPDIM